MRVQQAAATSQGGSTALSIGSGAGGLLMHAVAVLMPMVAYCTSTGTHMTYFCCFPLQMAQP